MSTPAQDLRRCPHAIAAAFNPYDGQAAADPDPLYERMQREAPIFYSPQLDMWVVSRHADICSVLKDPRRFSSADTFSGGAAFTPEALALLATGQPQTRTPINSDPPEHARLRRIVSSALTAKKVEALRPLIRSIAADLIDGFAQARRADLIAQFTSPFPIRTILRIIGIPHEDMAAIKQWSDDWFALLFAKVPPEEQPQRVQSYLNFQRYCERLIDERRKNPQDDALSEMLRAGAEDANPLTLAELISLVGGAFIAAGHETTSRMLGNVLNLLLSVPERWQAVQADPAVIPPYLEEALRLDGTVPGMIRTATEEVVVGGVTLPAGARLYLLYASGSQDAARFPSPREFRPDRENLPDHLAFGRGSHYCLGAQLARVQAQVALELLAQRLPGLRLATDSPMPYTSHLTIRGPAELWVEWELNQCRLS